MRLIFAMHVTNILQHVLVVLFLLFSCVKCVRIAGLPVTPAKDGDVIPLSFTSGGSPLVEELHVVPALGLVTLEAVTLPPGTTFVLLQAHSFEYNISLSFNRTLEPRLHVNGTNVGLVVQQGTPRVFLRNDNPSRNVSVLLVAQAYDNKTPIPGGCNMEFPVEIAPFLQVDYTASVVRVECQLAAPALPLTCVSTATAIDYEVYHRFLPERDFGAEAYFEAIRSFLTLDRVTVNGRKVPAPVGLPDIQRVFSAYPGTGSVYTVVARGARSGAAVYVPAVTYACSTVYWSDTCEVLTSTFSKLLCAIILFLGLFMCFVGHRFFKAEMFIFGFLSGGLVGFVLVAMPANFNYSAHLVTAVALGIISGGFWLALWWFYGIPALSTLLASLALGYLLAAIAVFAGTGDFEVFQSDVNFWLTFLCVVVSVPIILVMASHYANIVACSVLGAFAIVAPVDHYVGSNLKYIIINTVRRATVHDFRTAIIDPPFQTKDIALSISWGVLAAVGVGVQLYLQMGKPPFPPPPSGVLRDRQEMLGSERRPLLAGGPRPQGYVLIGSGGSDDSVYQPTPGPSSAQ